MERTQRVVKEREKRVCMRGGEREREGEGERDRERELGPSLGGAQVRDVRRYLLFVALRPHCGQKRGPDRHGPLLFGPNKSRWLKTCTHPKEHDFNTTNRHISRMKKRNHTK